MREGGVHYVYVTLYINYRTVFFAEYNCSGPGSNTSARVNYTTLLNSTEAEHLLDVNYIDGLDWLLLNDAAATGGTLLYNHHHLEATFTLTTGMNVTQYKDGVFVN